MADGAVRRASRDDSLALARAPVVRERAPPRLHPGPGRAAHLGFLLRGPRPALRGPDPARERGDLPALPAALPRDPTFPAPRLRPAPLVLPALGLLRGHAGRDGDGGRHRRLRGRLLLSPDPRPAPLGARDGVLPDREPRGCLPLLAPPREPLAAGPEPLPLGHARADADRGSGLGRRPSPPGPAALRRALVRRGRLRGRRPGEVGPVDRGLPGPRAHREAARDREEPRGGAAPLRHPAAAGRARAGDPGRLRRPQAQLQDPAGLLRLPERPGGRLRPLRSLARPPAAPQPGALRRGRARPARPRPAHPGHGGRRLDRQRGVPADRRPRPGRAGARRHRREQPVLPVPGPAAEAPRPRRPRPGGGHPRRPARRAAPRRVPSARRRPRRRPQARAAHGVRPRGGRQEQRARLPEPGEGRRPAGGGALRPRLDRQGGATPRA